MRSLLSTIAATSGLLLAAAACQQSVTTSSGPGALPRTADVQGVQPRVDASTYYAHGHLLERQGNLTRAVEQYQGALELSPNFVAARNRLGITLNKLGRHAEATDAFVIAVEQKPDEAYLYNNLGFSLYLEQRLEEAREVLEQAVELQPTFARARMNLALLLGNLGEMDAAFEQLQHVGNEADALYNMAILQTDGGDFMGAVQSLDRALNIDPNFEAARIQLRTVARLAAEAEAVRQAQVEAEQAAGAEVQMASAVEPTEEIDSEVEMAAATTPASSNGTPFASTVPWELPPPLADVALETTAWVDRLLGIDIVSVTDPGLVIVETPTPLASPIEGPPAPAATPTPTPDPTVDAEPALPPDSGIFGLPMVELMTWDELWRECTPAFELIPDDLQQTARAD